MRLKSLHVPVLTLALVLPIGCSDGGPTPGDSEAGDGDGDDDPGETGDGDGEPGDGDGDGEPGDGDGDGESGDGDGEPGDGDGDGDGEPGDGDGDELPGLPSDFLDQLTDVGGCGDVHIVVSDVDDTMGILFNGAELAATAHMLDEAQVRESTLPSEDVQLRIVLGSLLHDGCNDVGQGPIVQSQWTAVSGTVTLTIVPVGEEQPWETPANATLELSDVTFEGQGLAPVTIDSWTVQDVYVGWLPG